MPSLSYQAAFAPALLDGGRPVPDGVTAHTGDRPAKRFAVYRNNVVVGLIEALRVRFPVVEKLVGVEFFAGMARVFVAEHPPRSPLMMLYGDELAGFLERFPPAEELPYLPDVARLEAARTRAYHAADAPPRDAASFAALSADVLPELRLSLHPSVEIIRSAHPIVTIWAMNSGERPLAPVENWDGEDALVARPALAVEVCSLPPGTAVFAGEIAAGRPLGRAIEAALAQCADFDLAAALSLLIGRGLVTAATPEQKEHPR